MFTKLQILVPIISASHALLFQYSRQYSINRSFFLLIILKGESTLLRGGGGGGGGEGGGGYLLRLDGRVGGGALFVWVWLLLLCLHLFQVSVWSSNFSPRVSSHLICWFQYISSLSSLIQTFRVPFEGSIYTSCNFWIRDRVCSQEHLYCGILGDLLVLSSDDYNLLSASFFRPIIQWISEKNSIKSTYLAAIMFSTLGML